MTRLLVDTHVFLWLHTAPQRLGVTREVVEADDTELFLSPASSWEIAIKWNLGRLDLPVPPDEYVPSRMRLAQVQSLPIVHAHTLAVASLPDHHRDPFDRLLVAQSTLESLPLVTADPALRAYDVELVWVG